MARFDKYWIGILIGLVAPALFGYVYLETMHMWSILGDLHSWAHAIISKMLFVSVFPDLAMIFLFYTMELWNVSKGILIGALPYILAMIWVAM